MSFLRDYLEHATGNEAPYMFHVWCAYGCLSATTSRRTWMLLDDSAIYPNLYIMLVGGAGNGKTWSLAKAKRIIAELNLPFSGSVETPQGMWRFMTGDNSSNLKTPVPPYGGAEHKLFLDWPDGIKRDVHPMNIIASEFIDFINMDDKAWINALNNIYDEDVYHYRTKNMGTDLITGPYITLIGGLTTQISASMQKDNIINTGLARRTLFQFGERQWNNPHPNPVLTDSQKAARVRCMAHLEKVKAVTGQFQWTAETNTWWHEWYGKNLAAVPSKPPSVQSWFASKSTQLMKLAMLTSLSERLDKVLEVAHFELALDYLNELEKDLYRIFGGVGANQLADVAIKIFNYLQLQTEPVLGRLLKARHFALFPRNSNEGFRECMQHLQDDGKIIAKVFVVGSINDFLYATPEVWTKFEPVVSDVAPAEPQPEVQPESNQVSPVSIDPSTSPTPPHPLILQPLAPLTSAQLAGGIANGLLQ